jgi:hypothetical protein
MRAVLLGTLVALLLTQARADENVASAGSMLPYCKTSLRDTTGTFIEGFCAGIVVGVAALAQPLFAPGQSRATERCVHIPKSMSSGQLIQAVVSYIEARPQRKNEQFTVMTLEALFDAWPCRPSPPKSNDAPGPAPPVGSGHIETTHRRRWREGGAVSRSRCRKRRHEGRPGIAVAGTGLFQQHGTHRGCDGSSTPFISKGTIPFPFPSDNRQKRVIWRRSSVASRRDRPARHTSRIPIRTQAWPREPCSIPPPGSGLGFIALDYS